MTTERTPLRKRRDELGLTLRDVELCSAGRISNAYLSQLETGKIKNPSLEAAMALASVYFVSLELMAEWLGIEAPPARALCEGCGRPIP